MSSDDDEYEPNSDGEYLFDYESSEYDSEDEIVVTLKCGSLQ